MKILKDQNAQTTARAEAMSVPFRFLLTMLYKQPALLYQIARQLSELEL